MSNPSFSSSFVHRLPTGFKLGFLCLVSIMLLLQHSWVVGAVGLFMMVPLYWLAGFSPLVVLQQLRPVALLLAALFIFQCAATSWLLALSTSLRFSTLILLAALLNLTTPISKMTATLEKLLACLRPLGASPVKIALILSLTMRFIPVFSKIVHDVREAQRARGLERSILAVFVPVIIRMIKMQDDVALAIEARCYDSKKGYEYDNS